MGFVGFVGLVELARRESDSKEVVRSMASTDPIRINDVAALLADPYGICGDLFTRTEFNRPIQLCFR